MSTTESPVEVERQGETPPPGLPGALPHLSGNPLGPALPELSPKAELALLARLLFREGYDDHLAGHITVRQPDGTYLVNPFGLTWDEVRAGDIMRMAPDGQTIEGPWTVSPAVVLHLAIHEHRDDANVIVHNHPRYGTIWGNAHRVPPIYDQTSGQVLGDPLLYEDYDGVVAHWDVARDIAARVGDASTALLANHGVLVMGKDVAQAHHRSVFLEWRCRQAWKVEAIGGGTPLDDEQTKQLGTIFEQISFPHLFEAMARRELRLDPSVLDED